MFVVMTMESLRCQLNQDEERDALRGHPSLHAVTASHFIWNAIQIEEQQYVPSATVR